MEQYNSNNIIQHISKMNNSEAVWEFSMKNYEKYNIPIQKLWYQPVPYYDYTYIENKDYKYDILFYGVLNKRREDILKELSKRYRVFYSGTIFGKEKEEYIKLSKIIINLHYYKDAVLETSRINDALIYNKIIISENSKYTDRFIYYMYKDLVVYFDEINENLSNINQLYDIINIYLTVTHDIKKDNLIQLSEFFLLKNLVPFGIVKNILYDISHHIYCISLLENYNRSNLFFKQDVPQNVIIYPAIKYNPG
jgi:hypothetical protein